MQDAMRTHTRTAQVPPLWRTWFVVGLMAFGEAAQLLPLPLFRQQAAQAWAVFIVVWPVVTAWRTTRQVAALDRAYPDLPAPVRKQMHDGVVVTAAIAFGVFQGGFQLLRLCGCHFGPP
jgi:hypothetical protein